MKPISIAVVGLRKDSMGCGYLEIYRDKLSDQFEVVAVCDADPRTLQWAGEEYGCDVRYTHYAQMLSDIRPEPVLIATPTYLHASMVETAVQLGVQSIYCEKPAAVSYGDALEMQKICRQSGVKLVIGHQRRVSPAYIQLAEWMEEGKIGDIHLIRGSCPGDLMTDGTHLVDSVLYLMKDERPQWVLGQVYLDEQIGTRPAESMRYGHYIERGAMATLEFSGKRRCELYVGQLSLPHAGYQDVEVLGSKGRMRLPGDSDHPVLLLDEGSGYRSCTVNKRPVEDYYGMYAAQERFAQYVRGEEAHPMRMDTAIGSMEVLTGIMESARLSERLCFPITQRVNPLELMVQKANPAGEPA